MLEEYCAVGWVAVVCRARVGVGVCVCAGRLWEKKGGRSTLARRTYILIQGCGYQEQG